MGRKLRHIQPVFNKGEVSPRIRGRVDNEAYYKGYDYSENFIPFPEGAMTFRPGTVYVNEVKTSSKITIIRPFRFSTVQNYVLEFGDQYMRVYRNRGVVETSPGTPFELATPFLEADLRELYFWQSADVLYVAHPDYQTQKITRTSDTNWTIGAITFKDGPYLPINSTATTLARSGTTVTASASLFVSTDVGRQLRIKNGSSATSPWLSMIITGFTSATQVTVDISGTISATASWRIGAFGGNRGWPAVGTIYEERMILARTVNQPSTVWGSITGDFETFSPSNLDDGVVRDDDGFAFTISDDQVNSINWMSSGRILLIGTSGSEHTLSGGTSSTYAPITPTNVTIRRETNFGSKANIRAHRIGNAVIFPSQSSKKFRELYYEFGIDSYISKDMTLFSEHILRDGALDTEYVQEPDPYFWVAKTGGQLVGCVYERLQEIEGWHRHIIGGTNSAVESLAVIPRPGSEEDDLWLLIKRTIDGKTVRYIEYLSEIFEDVEADLEGPEDRFYAKNLDSCITYDGYRDTTLTPSATTGTSVTFTAGTSIFTAADIGSEIKSGSGRAIITAQAGSTATADITAAFASTSAISAGGWSVASKSFSGLNHLEGEIVGVQVDGGITDDQTVSSGAIAIDNFASVVHVGLKYTGRLRLLPPDFPEFKTVQGLKKSVSEAHVYVTDTYGLKVKSLDVNLTDIIKFQQTPIMPGQAPALVTGLITFHPPSGYEKADQLEFIHDIAMPCTINYIIQEMDVNN